MRTCVCTLCECGKRNKRQETKRDRVAGRIKTPRTKMEWLLGGGAHERTLNRFPIPPPRFSRTWLLLLLLPLPGQFRSALILRPSIGGRQRRWSTEESAFAPSGRGASEEPDKAAPFVCVPTRLYRAALVLRAFLKEPSLVEALGLTLGFGGVVPGCVTPLVKCLVCIFALRPLENIFCGNGD